MVRTWTRRGEPTGAMRRSTGRRALDAVQRDGSGAAADQTTPAEDLSPERRISPMPKPLGQPGEQRNGTSWPPRELRGDETRGARLCCPGARATRPRALRCASSARHRGRRPRVERLRRFARARAAREAREPRVRGREVPLVEEVSGRRARPARASRQRRRRRGRDADGVQVVQAGVRQAVRQQGDARARARDATRPTSPSAPPFCTSARCPSTSRPSLTPLPATQVVMLGHDAAGKTTILYKLHIGEVLSTVPTLGTPDPHPSRGSSTRASDLAQPRSGSRSPLALPPRRRPRLPPRARPARRL